MHNFRELVFSAHLFWMMHFCGCCCCCCCVAVNLTLTALSMNDNCMYSTVTETRDTNTKQKNQNWIAVYTHAFMQALVYFSRIETESRKHTFDGTDQRGYVCVRGYTIHVKMFSMVEICGEFYFCKFWKWKTISEIVAAAEYMMFNSVTHSRSLYTRRNYLIKNFFLFGRVDVCVWGPRTFNSRHLNVAYKHYICTSSVRYVCDSMNFLRKSHKIKTSDTMRYTELV